MIDCSKTMNYFIEKSRMIKQQKDGVCKLDCSDCPLSISNNGTSISCSYFETGYPEKAMTFVRTAELRELSKLRENMRY